MASVVLKVYLLGFRNTINAENMSNKLSETEKTTAVATINDGLSWLENNKNASDSSVKEKQTECELVLQPLMNKMYDKV
jgi:hypothetical protein